MEPWSSGGVLRAWELCLKRSGVREACCGPEDVEVFASRGLEACCGPGDVEVASIRALEMRCRRVDVEMFCLKRPGALEARCRRCPFASLSQEL